MVRNSQVLSVLTLVCLFSAPGSVLADPIRVEVTAGTIGVGHLDIAGAALNIAGTRGFSFQGGSDSALAHAQSCLPCFSGDRISLSAEITGFFSGTGMLAGRTYEFDISNGGGALTHRPVLQHACFEHRNRVVHDALCARG